MKTWNKDSSLIHPEYYQALPNIFVGDTASIIIIIMFTIKKKNSELKWLGYNFHRSARNEYNKF